MPNTRINERIRVGESEERVLLPILWIAVLAPVAAFTDTIISMIRFPRPDEYDAAVAVFPPLAATTLAAILVLLAIWGLLAAAARAGLNVPVHSLLISISIALFSFMALALLAGVVLPTEMVQDSATGLFKLAVVGAVSLVMLRGGYLIGLDLERRLLQRRSPLLLVLALPYVTASLLLLVWVSRFRLDAALVSRDGLVIAAIAGGFVLLSLAFFYLAGHHRVGRAAALFPVFAVLLAPLFAPLVAARFEPRDPGESTPGQTQKAVFLITIDSLRADVLSCYGAEQVQTQHIDRLAQDGMLFENAISASSWTLPSVASFMTGVSPLIHGATAWQARLPDRFKTLAEYFKEAGYRTVAIGQNPVLDPARNVNQGFDEYQWISAETRHPAVSIGKSILGAVLPRKAISFTEEITDGAIARLGIASEGPVFYWIHYFDPHLPYAPPAAYLSEAERANPMGMEFNEFERVRMGRFGGRQEERDWIRSLYEGEVRFVDDEFGRLMEAIKAQGLYEGATFIVSSDHGEEFWDHGGFEHGHTMHRELLRVPLIIKGPAVTSPGRVEAPVGTEALAPTILELAGLPYDAASMTSASFMAYLNPSSPPPTPGSVMSFGTLYFDELEAVTTPEFKYIQAVDFGTEKLYNRTVDPLELTPLNVEEHAAAAEGARQLLNQAHGVSGTTGTTEKESVEMDAATEESLRSLGYID